MSIDIKKVLEKRIEQWRIKEKESLEWQAWNQGDDLKLIRLALADLTEALNIVNGFGAYKAEMVCSRCGKIDAYAKPGQSCTDIVEGGRVCGGVYFKMPKDRD